MVTRTCLLLANGGDERWTENVTLMEKVRDDCFANF